MSGARPCLRVLKVSRQGRAPLTGADQLELIFASDFGHDDPRIIERLYLLDDLFAGSLVLMWSKVSPLVHGYRRAANVHDYGLNFEALAKALDVRMTERGEPHAAVD